MLMTERTKSVCLNVAAVGLSAVQRSTKERFLSFRRKIKIACIHLSFILTHCLFLILKGSSDVEILEEIGKDVGQRKVEIQSSRNTASKARGSRGKRAGVSILDSFGITKARKEEATLDHVVDVGEKKRLSSAEERESQEKKLRKEKKKAKEDAARAKAKAAKAAKAAKLAERAKTHSAVSKGKVVKKGERSSSRTDSLSSQLVKCKQLLKDVMKDEVRLLETSFYYLSLTLSLFLSLTHSLARSYLHKYFACLLAYTLTYAIVVCTIFSPCNVLCRYVSSGRSLTFTTVGGLQIQVNVWPSLFLKR